MIFTSLEELFVAELLELRSVEMQLVKAFKELISKELALEIGDVLKGHLQVVKTQEKRVEATLVSMQINLTKQEECRAIRDLVGEFEEICSGKASDMVKAAALIGSLQKVAHYKIACYGTAKAHAMILDMSDVAKSLAESLEEEGSFDKMLTKVAEGSFFSSGVNQQAIV